ncbi:hypothetical protein JW979_02820 [bacterium]|nr:hypothetical protein [candidate division CSSED10-310 bacterium]
MKRFRICLYFFLLLYSNIFLSCDSWRDSPLDLNHTITIRNLTQCELYVVLDGNSYINLLDYNSSGSFENVSKGYHELTAYIYNESGIAIEIASLDLVITERKDYYWTIRECSFN